MHAVFGVFAVGEALWAAIWIARELTASHIMRALPATLKHGILPERVVYDGSGMSSKTSL